MGRCPVARPCPTSTAWSTFDLSFSGVPFATSHPKANLIPPSHNVWTGQLVQTTPDLQTMHNHAMPHTNWTPRLLPDSNDSVSPLGLLPPWDSSKFGFRPGYPRMAMHARPNRRGMNARKCERDHEWWCCAVAPGTRAYARLWATKATPFSSQTRNFFPFTFPFFSLPGHLGTSKV